MLSLGTGWWGKGKRCGQMTPLNSTVLKARTLLCHLEVTTLLPEEDSAPNPTMHLGENKLLNSEHSPCSPVQLAVTVSASLPTTEPPPHPGHPPRVPRLQRSRKNRWHLASLRHDSVSPQLERTGRGSSQQGELQPTLTQSVREKSEGPSVSLS